jgi:antitoxin component YwqK of YwqJK toxin-antitoxin module
MKKDTNLISSPLRFLLVLFALMTLSTKAQVKEEFYTKEELKSAGLYPEIRKQLKSTGEYTEGQKTGVWKYFYINGQLKDQEEYDAEGNRSGKWISYQKNGDIIEQCDYWKGQKTGEKLTFYENGKLKERMTYIFDALGGPYEAFFQDGVLKETGEFSAGMRTGEWKSYYESGNLSVSANYITDKDLDSVFSGIGQLHGSVTFYYENGKEAISEQYYKGLKDKIHYYYFEDGSIYLSTLWHKGKFMELLEVNTIYPDTDTLAVRVFHDYNQQFLALSGQLIEGQKGGYWVTYYAPHELRSIEGIHAQSGFLSQGGGEMKDGLMSGSWAFVNKQGKLTWKGNYQKGEKDGVWEYYIDYQNNSPSATCSFERGQPKGKLVIEEKMHYNRLNTYTFDFESMNNYTVEIAYTARDKDESYTFTVLSGKIEGGKFTGNFKSEGYLVTYKDGVIVDTTYEFNSDEQPIFEDILEKNRSLWQKYLLFDADECQLGEEMFPENFLLESTIK